MNNSDDVGNQRKSQAALDFMISYGVAIIVISIVLLTVAQLGVFNPLLTPTYCNAAPSFACSGASIRANSLLTIVLSQASGGTMNVIGAACSSLANTVNVIGGPMYGNLNVGYSAGTASSYYPNTALANGFLLYSGNTLNLTVYCYGGAGQATGSLGSTFSGVVWLNFTITSLPNSANNIVPVATFTSRYT
jgi:hypothetical protein